MDIFELEKAHEVEEEQQEQQQQIEQSMVVLSKDEKADIFREELQKQQRLMRLKLAVWAEEKSIIQGVPNIDKLNVVWEKLKAGETLIKSIEGVCSYPSWLKWRKEYPEIAAMEEQCRQERIAKLEEEMRKIADQPDRIKMGATARDKLMIDVRQKEVERLDRLTENRLEKNNAGATVPIQINIVGVDKDGKQE